MGLFDHYFPDSQLSCPRCGRDLPREWQGKDGPCFLDHYKQGQASAIDTDWCEEDMNCSKEEYLESTKHPEGNFLIYTSCEGCDRLVYAKITVKEETWVSTHLLGPEDIDVEFWHLPKERRKEMKQWLTKPTSSADPPPLAE